MDPKARSFSSCGRCKVGLSPEAYHVIEQYQVHSVSRMPPIFVGYCMPRKRSVSGASSEPWLYAAGA